MKKQYWKGIATGVVGVLAFQLVVILVLNYCLNGIGLYGGAHDSALGKNTSQALSKMNTLNYYINKYYMDGVEEGAVTDGIYKGMLESLQDPYSVYYTKKEYDELLEDSSGEYCGIGAIVTQQTDNNAIVIVSVLKDSGAEKAGVESGDILTKIEGKDIRNMDLNTVVAKIKGEEGTKVNVQIYDKSEEAYVDKEIERTKVEVPTVTWEMKGDKIGYIAVSSFDEPTDEQFIKAIEELKKEGMKGLIVDLRNNGGGMLTTVVNMLDNILPKGSMIVSTKDKNGQGEEYKAKSEEQLDLPMVVLINGNTASASEVFSGAIQDYKLGKLVGTKSFGKGIVQSVIPLGDGTALKLTTSKYFTPNGRNIHGTGIEPDVKVELNQEDKVDNQYAQAVKVLKNLMEMKDKSDS